MPRERITDEFYAGHGDGEADELDGTAHPLPPEQPVVFAYWLAGNE